MKVADLPSGIYDTGAVKGRIWHLANGFGSSRWETLCGLASEPLNRPFNETLCGKCQKALDALDRFPAPEEV